MAEATVQCARQGCAGVINRVELHKTTLVWTFESGRWQIGAIDEASHFQLFCSEGHELKRVGNALPEAIHAIVFPQQDRPPAEPPSRPPIDAGSPAEKKFDRYVKKHFPSSHSLQEFDEGGEG
jgi:hypothetical protein